MVRLDYVYFDTGQLFKLCHKLIPRIRLCKMCANFVANGKYAVSAAGFIGTEAPYVNYLPEFYQDGPLR